MIYKKRLNGRLPDGRGAYILKAEIESRQPIKPKLKGKLKTAHISKGIVTVLKTSGTKEFNKMNIGLTFQIKQRNLIMKSVSNLYGKCRGSKMHHRFRIIAEGLLIL